jgi:hypothetical protein
VRHWGVFIPLEGELKHRHRNFLLNQTAVVGAVDAGCAALCNRTVAVSPPRPAASSNPHSIANTGGLYECNVRARRMGFARGPPSG